MLIAEYIVLQRMQLFGFFASDVPIRHLSSDASGTVLVSAGLSKICTWILTISESTFFVEIWRNLFNLLPVRPERPSTSNSLGATEYFGRAWSRWRDTEACSPHLFHKAWAPPSLSVVNLWASSQVCGRSSLLCTDFHLFLQNPQYRHSIDHKRVLSSWAYVCAHLSDRGHN